MQWYTQNFNYFITFFFLACMWIMNRHASMTCLGLFSIDKTFYGTSSWEGNFQSKRNFRRGNSVLLSDRSKWLNRIACNSSKPSVITDMPDFLDQPEWRPPFFFPGNYLLISRLTQIIFTWFAFSVEPPPSQTVFHFSFSVAAFNCSLFTCLLPGGEGGGEGSHIKRTGYSSYLLF